ncbi:MAG: PIN domain-containing protein [Proteobacteria bacterium]|nr:PIN domain-containing protein [Pseudomonadota bacterium]
MRFTFDSNILVYTADLDAGGKRRKALEIVGRAQFADCALTLQSLAEFFYVTTRKGKLGLGRAEEFVGGWRSTFPVHAASENCLADAMEAARHHRLSFWDAMMWAAARDAGCRILLTEDFQDGQNLEGLRFVNPFVAANDALLDVVLA